ncbi:MAG: hypothetical protein ABR520_04420 [Mycobacteriales bacterium]
MRKRISVLGVLLTAGAAAALPAHALLPRAGCADIVDAKGDGTAVVVATTLPNDDDLDITSVSFRTTPATIEAYVTVAKYSAAGPELGTGHKFDFGFTANGKTFVFASDKTATVNGSANAAIKVTSSVEANTVVISVDRPSLDAGAGAAVSDGTVATAVAAHSAMTEPGGVSFAADTATAKDADAAHYEIGASACFEGPPGLLRYVGSVAAQWGDSVRVAAELTDDGGKEGVAGKRITFRIGTATATATTNRDGRAETRMAVSADAGSYTLSASYAGDASVGHASTTAGFTVKLETTRIAISGDASAGFTITLTDDDGQPVSNEEVEWTVDGKSAGKTKTDGHGRAKFKGGKRGSKVGAKYHGHGGRYGGCAGGKTG